MVCIRPRPHDSRMQTTRRGPCHAREREDMLATWTRQAWYERGHSRLCRFIRTLRARIRDRTTIMSSMLNSRCWALRLLASTAMAGPQSRWRGHNSPSMLSIHLIRLRIMTASNWTSKLLVDTLRTAMRRRMCTRPMRWVRPRRTTSRHGRRKQRPKTTAQLTRTSNCPRVQARHTTRAITTSTAARTPTQRTIPGWRRSC